MSELVIVPAETLEELRKGLQNIPDLQRIIGFTDFVQEKLKRGVFLSPRDRDPLTVMIGSQDFSSDPAVAGGEVAAGSTVVLAEYEVPENRVGEVCHLDITTRAIVALGAAQTQFVATQYRPPSSETFITQRSQHGLATGAGGVVTISTSGSHWLMPRWRVRCIASLGAGVGTLRAQGSIQALEYSL